MAMAIHSAKILSDILQLGLNRNETEKAYSKNGTEPLLKDYGSEPDKHKNYLELLLALN